MAPREADTVLSHRATARRRFLRGQLGLALVGPMLARAAVPRETLTKRAIAFGTHISITVAGMDKPLAERAINAALAEVAAVDAAVSLHSGRSPLALLNRTGRVAEPSLHLRRLLQQACHWSELTAGGFDVTVQPLWQMHFAASVRGEGPRAAALERCRELIDWRGIDLGPTDVSFARPGMQATLNGLAQGYASDCAWDVLKAHGVEHALIDAGEWRAAGRPQTSRSWQMGVRNPRAGASSPGLLDVVALDDAALASSGDDAFCFTPDRRLHHILDPRTGWSPSELAGATVLASDACTADAVSTACMVLGVERSLALAQQHRGIELLLVRKNGEVLLSGGWPGSRRAT